eukprot:scpid32794/ scgid27614/ Protein white
MYVEEISMSSTDVEAGLKTQETVETGFRDPHVPVAADGNLDDEEKAYSVHDEPGEVAGALQTTARQYSELQTNELERQQSLRGNVTLSWHNLKVDLVFERGCLSKLRGEPAPEPKPILKKVSGSVRPGWLVAVMGASGAGKTTLLNALCGRSASNMSLEGVLNINGQLVTPHDIKRISAYVQQQDLAFATLTVFEHLKFQALLRMDKRLSPEERMQRVEDVITELGLQKCRNNKIGSPTGVRGISGGELKRLSFASEVLMDPPLLFVDEPTSGLDSFMAQSVISSLQDMAREGRTILCTIHQPPSEVFAMFNRLLLLAEGKTVYYGPRSEALEYFKALEHPCPDNYNPADHYIYTLAIVPQKEDESRERVKVFTDEYDRREQEKEQVDFAKKKSRDVDVDIRAARKLHGESRWTQFKLVMWRTWLTTAREPTLTRVRFMQALFVGVFVGLIFLQVQEGQSSVQNLNGVLFFAVIQASFSVIFSVIQVFPDEKHIFYRDADNHMYKTWIYMLTKTIAEIPFQLTIPLVFQAVIYFMIGLNPRADRFFTLYAVFVTMALAAQSIGYVISAAVPSVAIGLAVTPPLVIPFMLFGGLFLNSDDIPDYFIWLEYISWIKYGFEAAMINEWDGKSISGCAAAVATTPMSTLTDLEANMTSLTVAPTSAMRNMTAPGSMGMPCFSDGSQVLNFYAFDPDNLVLDIGILIVLSVAFRILAYLILELILWNRNRHTK